MAQRDQISGCGHRAGTVIDQDRGRTDIAFLFEGPIEDDDRRPRRDEIAPHLRIAAAGRRHKHAVELPSA